MGGKTSQTPTSTAGASGAIGPAMTTRLQGDISVKKDTGPVIGA